MVSLSGIRKGTFDQLFIRNEEGVSTEIRDLLTTGGSGVSTEFLTSSLLPLELSNLLNSATLTTHTDNITALEADVLTLQQQTIVDGITPTELTTALAPLIQASNENMWQIEGHQAHLGAISATLTSESNRITTVVAQSAQNALDNTSLYQGVTQLNSSLATISTDLLAAETAVSTLETTVGSMLPDAINTAIALQLLLPRDAQISTLNTNVAQNTTNIISHGAQLVNHGNDISALETDVTNLSASQVPSATVSTLQTDVTNLETTLNTTTATAAQALTTANGAHVSAYNATQTANALSGTVSSLGSTVTTLAVTQASLDAQGDLHLPGKTISADRVEVSELESAHGVYGASQDNLCIFHKQLSTTNYSMRVKPDGEMRLNVPLLKSMLFNINNVTQMHLNASALNIATSLIVNNARLGQLTNTSSASFSHFLNTSGYNYAIEQNQLGATSVNSADGTTLRLCVNDTPCLEITSTILTTSLPILSGALVAESARIGMQIGHPELGLGLTTASFCHLSNTSGTDYALQHFSNGQTNLNCKAGTAIHFSVGGVHAMEIDSSRDVTIDESLTAHTCYIGPLPADHDSNFVLRHTSMDETLDWSFVIASADSGYTSINAGPAGSPNQMYLRTGGNPKIRIRDTQIDMYPNTVFLANLTVNGTKAFDMNHPTKENHRLRHRCIEADRAINVYRHQLQCTQGMNRFPLPDWWVINAEPMAWVSPYRHRGQGWADVEENELVVDVSKAGLYNVWLTGLRNDQMAQDEFAQYGVEYVPEEEEISP